MALTLSAFVLGFAGGYSIKVDSERKRVERTQEELFHASELSHAALKTTECVLVLKLLREKEPDSAAQRLETLLDFALIDIAREYSPTRDSLGTASNALRFARTYRVEHPRHGGWDYIEQQADAAFQLIPRGSP
jgi:hypothetical protein